jgi:glycosyltransferase involved in cell wall biosynthesis
LIEHKRQTTGADPLVSVIVPMRNEATYIGACLQSILDSTWSGSDVEIIVVDGQSDDDSVAIVNDFASRHPQIRTFPNALKTASHAMNIGIQEARGDYVLRMDAHVVYDRHYIERSVSLLRDNAYENVVAVGGIALPMGRGLRSSAIALAVSSPFGAGDAHYRLARTPRLVDTIWNGCWQRETLRQAGGFDEQWLRNQDYELNYRLRRAGGQLLLDPSVRCHHYMRESLRRLARQYFEFGTWRVRTIVTHPGSLRWRQLIAPLFVLLLIACAVIGATLTVLPLLILVGGYAGSALVAASLAYRRTQRRRRELPVSAAVTATRRFRQWQLIPVTAIAFVIIHLAWGCGFFNGIYRFWLPRVRWFNWRQQSGHG